MNHSKVVRHYIVVKLHWLIDDPTTSLTAGLTCYREELGPNDLFSVFVRFEPSPDQSKPCAKAKIFALVEEMSLRLPSKGGKIVLTAGSKPIALAETEYEGDQEM